MDPRTRSRTVIGFHRLGVVLAVPLLLGALGTAISGSFSSNGPVVPDQTANSPRLRVETAPRAIATNEKLEVVSLSKDGRWVPLNLSLDEKNALLSAQRQLTRVRKGEVTSIASYEVDTGTIRTFAFYWADPSTFTNHH
jgi:hypothetical protein